MLNVRERRVTKRVAKLLKKAGYERVTGDDHWLKLLNGKVKHSSKNLGQLKFDRAKLHLPQPTLERAARFIREYRGVHIMINRNASGYFWEMMKADTGTDLGYSRTSGPNAGGVWDTYDGALENGVIVQLSMHLPTNTVLIRSWSNYASEAIKKFKLCTK